MKLNLINKNDVDLNFAGIYIIENINTNKKYIGQTKALLKRYNQHKNDLNKNKHFNLDLQIDFNIGNEFNFIPIKNYNIKLLNRMEKFYIKKYDTFIGNGYNKCAGGLTFGTGHFDLKIYSFIHKSGIIETCTQYKLNEKYGFINGKISAVVNNKRKSYKGWSLSTTNINSIKYRDEQFIFLHISGINEYCTMEVFCKKYNFESCQISRLCSGKRRSYKGWYLNKIDNNNISNKDIIFNFKHISGIEEMCTQKELYTKYSLSSRGNISSLCSKKLKSYKGWSIIYK